MTKIVDRPKVGDVYKFVGDGFLKIIQVGEKRVHIRYVDSKYGQYIPLEKFAYDVEHGFYEKVEE